MSTDEGSMTEEERQQAIGKIADVKGVSASLAERMFNKGFVSLKKIANSSIEALCEVDGIKDKTAKKILEAVGDIIGSKKKLTATEMLNKFNTKMKNKEYVDSGSEELNRLLGGGYLTGVSYDLYGAMASGKTEELLTAACSAFRPYGEGGLKKEGEDISVLLIDSEGTFTQAVSRLPNMCERFGVDLDYVTNHIVVCSPTSSEQQILMVKAELENVLNGKENYKIVIVDSIIAHFRAEYIGRGKLANRQQLLNSHIKDLKDIIYLTDGILMVSNQVQSNPAAFFGDPDKETGGNIVGHNIDVHLYFKRTSPKKAYRLVSLMDSSWLPQGDAKVLITAHGIDDATDAKKTTSKTTTDESDEIDEDEIDEEGLEE